MTDDQYATPQSEPVAPDFDDVFDDWLAGANINKRSVPVYSKPGLFAEYEELERARQIAVAEEGEAEEASLGASTVAEIDERLAELHREWAESKATWIIRGLNDDDTDAINAELEEAGHREPDVLEEPVAPDSLPKNASSQQGRSHTEAMKRYEVQRAEYEAKLPAHEKARTAYRNEVNLRVLQRSIVEIKRDGRPSATSVTLEQLRKMQAVLGKRQVLSLLKAGQLAMLQEPEIPAPFSRRTSEDDQT